MEKLVVEEGIQDIFECQESIRQLGMAIGTSDFTSTLVTKMRINSMRELIRLLEKYNDQLIVLRED